MGKTLICLLIVTHGLIHLIGFVKGFGIAELSSFSGRTIIFLSKGASQSISVLWLVACMLFLVAGAGLWLHKDWWFLIAATAIILSQLLIIIYWPDARAGTIANIILLPFIIIAWANSNFNKMADREVKAIMINAVPVDRDTLKPQVIERLPYCVQKWLLRSGVVGKEVVHMLYLQQKGEMSTRPGGKWMNTEAEQYFTIDKPAFVWKAKVKMMPGVILMGRDKFENGKGNMLIRALALFPVVNAKGKETDQGTMLRFLGEMCWCPSAALEPYITWEELSATEARATMAYNGIQVSGIYKFTPEGDFESFTAKRYMNDKGKVSLEDWYIPATQWKEMDGIRIPVKGVVTWKLKGGDFDYYKWEITQVVYNKSLK